MFYAHFVLAKKGPLARIWLAAHWDKKLTKAHVYETNIESSVEGIMQPKVKMALRTSGHLLLGVVRIYSRKAKYLLADCNEAFVKIKMAFRPGMVDLPEDKREAAMNAITLPDVFHDFDTAMPDLDDVDIDSQFTLNQTRAEEITMREDYGNLTLSAGDDGFGEGIGGEFESEETPEIMRDSSVQNSHFGSLGGGELSLETGEQQLSVAQQQPGTSKSGLDAPINDDGFGGVGLVQDILSGGLFEGGSLFDDPVPGGSASVRAPPSERTAGGFDDDDFPGMPSPVHSDGSGPGSPAPSIDQLSEAPPPKPVETTAPLPAQSPRKMDTTTLLHNEEESFALAPVEASALKGVRRQRKRKLIVDDIKAITGEGMKAQLSDSQDIVTTLDIAPPTKRLMHWKETGGVEELFSLPGRKLRAVMLNKDYQANLRVKAVSAEEQFETLPGGEELELEQVGAGEADVTASPRRQTKRRKVAESPAQSAYARRQEELARQQEEFAREQEQLRAGEASREASLALATPNTSWAELQGGAASPYPAPPPATPGQAASFTADWVSQVQPGEPGLASPPPLPASPAKLSLNNSDPQDDWDNDMGNDDFGGGDDYYDDGEDEGQEEAERTGEEEQEMQEDETIEEFEDRVLNKRASQLHRQLTKKFADRFSQLGRKNNRKQAAQKFHSLLVLQKMMALEISQQEDVPYSEIEIRKGSTWLTATHSL